ncbi:hypothetical protein NSND_62542 [Nitrospira sp. ND1]|jgi:hypothetical protein|nr:hypothetical protein NSND_62542 [Nitrospira sp. ND1]
MLGAKEGVAAVALSTAQIGKCGELLVQYRLLLLGVESAPMSTDTGIDLVAYSPAMLQPGLSDFLCVRRVSFTPHSD